MERSGTYRQNGSLRMTQSQRASAAAAEGSRTRSVG